MRTSLLTCLVFLSTCSLQAQWNGNPAVADTRVCTAPTNEFSKMSVTDGSNGSIVVFESSSATTFQSAIYAQRISSAGTAVWGSLTSPKPVCVLPGRSAYLNDVLPDGSGGVFIAWQDYRNNADNEDVYVQHLNSSGDPLWPVNGVRISTNTTTDNYYPRLCLNNTGGVIVTWNEEIYDVVNETATFLQVYAQSLNNAGVPQWASRGVQLSTAAGLRGLPDIVPDGSGGAIVVFVDTRNSNYFPGAEIEYDNIDLYAQRINASGTLLWTNNGAVVCNEPNIQFIDPYLNTTNVVSDGAGGVNVVFQDYRLGNTGTADLYSQRLNSAGVRQWAASGVATCLAAGEQYPTNVISDGAQGFVIVWDDERSSTNRVVTQNINAAGTPAWTANGLIISPLTGFSQGGDVVQDGTGSYLFAWQSSITSSSTGSKIIKAQRVTAAGTLLYATGGVNVCTNTLAQPQDAEVVKSIDGTGIITWLDQRNPTYDIYAAKLESTGALPLNLLRFTAALVRNQVVADWATANEQNTLHFEVQRSYDNINYKTVATIAAKGTSTAQSEYKYVDAWPTPGISYYRLKQVDKDGAFTYSTSKLVNIRDLKSNFRLLGNPVQDQALLAYYAGERSTVQINVFDHLGRLVEGKQVLAEPGLNNLSLQTSRLAAGTYQVILTGKGDRLQVTMLKD